MYDRIKETASTITGSTAGTATATLSGAATGGFLTFSSRFATGATYQAAAPIYYCITSDNDKWEVGKGYLTSSTNLVREVFYDSSSGLGTGEAFSGATSFTVFCTIPAERMEEMWTKGQAVQLSLGNVMP
jgi:hypothetical protein